MPSSSFDTKGESSSSSCTRIEYAASSYEDFVNYPNSWSRAREYLREPAAEFFGVLLFIVFGLGVNCQVSLGGNPLVASSAHGDFLSVNFGWAVGAAMGVWVSIGISGGHINPAVTLAVAVFRGFPWKKVPIYIAAQVLGAGTGAALVYLNFFHAIDLVEGHGIRTLATARLFSTYALDYMTNPSCFFSEFFTTIILVFAILAILDKKSSPPPAGLAPLAVFLLVLGIGTSLGMETSYALNPARDLGPRLFTAVVGYGPQVFSFRNQYWLWCPIIAPILGALVATFLYDALLYTGTDSILNKPNAKARNMMLRATKEKRPVSEMFIV
ncbi:hypothetical protein M413DRAFT_443824 [Hebeloma cylindrosporum]|uniref:Aquaporin n=1 Tax=Hebeloma cylindrosporum TaxID=76867 RepID=A0A0C3CFR5_HEBCY|nr:hypothetical protein M413DRAFT_443824 [Hebeloma cylindrosporum h7]